MNNKAAFSIVEIIVVIVIMGVCAAMAIPNYLVGLSRTSARNALDNLLAIQTSQIVYAEVKGGYYVSASVPSDDTANINQALNINITPSGQTVYYCDSSSICHAVHSGTGSFDIGLDLRLSMNKISQNLVYCNASGPDVSYNPCCFVPSEGAQTAGSICP